MAGSRANIARMGKARGSIVDAVMTVDKAASAKVDSVGKVVAGKVAVDVASAQVAVADSLQPLLVPWTTAIARRTETSQTGPRIVAASLPAFPSQTFSPSPQSALTLRR